MQGKKKKRKEKDNIIHKFTNYTIWTLVVNQLLVNGLSNISDPKPMFSEMPGEVWKFVQRVSTSETMLWHCFLQHENNVVTSNKHIRTQRQLQSMLSLHFFFILDLTEFCDLDVALNHSQFNGDSGVKHHTAQGVFMPYFGKSWTTSCRCVFHHTHPSTFLLFSACTVFISVDLLTCFHGIDRIGGGDMLFTFCILYSFLHDFAE